jgi:Ricin-type beta-trefoil lectin domain-like
MHRNVLAAVITALALCATPALAGAQSLNSVSLVSSATNRYLPLDVSGAATYAGAPVIQWLANVGSNQRWNFVQQPDGNEEIVNQNSGMCLTSDGVAGHWVYQWPCAGYPQQEWAGTLESAWGGSSHGLKTPGAGCGSTWTATPTGQAPTSSLGMATAAPGRASPTTSSN